MAIPEEKNQLAANLQKILEILGRIVTGNMHYISEENRAVIKPAC